jgi:ureidoacrylate peracid hydrolase
MPEPAPPEIVLEQGKYGGPRFEGLASAAVLVVDMINDFGHPDGVYGRNGVHCDSFPAAVRAAGAVVRAALASGIPTVAANQFIFADRAGRAVAGGGLVEGRPWLESDGLRAGTWGVELVADIPRTDYVVEKPRASAFFGTPLEVLLRGLGVTTLVVVGCYTNQCVESTVRDAWARDFRIVIVTDAVAAFDPVLHDAALQSLRPLASQIASEAVIALFAVSDLSMPDDQPERG